MIEQTPLYLRNWIREASGQYGVPPELLSSLLYHESSFRPRVVSPAGAIGIAQFMPGTARQYGVNPYDPYESIMGSARYLSDLQKQFNDWNLALAAYNAGPGNVRKYGGVPPFRETQAFVKNVMGKAGFSQGQTREALTNKPKTYRRETLNLSALMPLIENQMNQIRETLKRSAEYRDMLTRNAQAMLG